MRNHCRFVLCSNSQIYGGDFAKFWDFLRIYEPYMPSLQFCLFFHYTHEYTYNTTIFAWGTQTRLCFKLIAYDSRTNAICIYDCTFYVASFTIVHAAQHTTKLCHVYQMVKLKFEQLYPKLSWYRLTWIYSGLVKLDLS